MMQSVESTCMKIFRKFKQAKGDFINNLSIAKRRN